MGLEIDWWSVLNPRYLAHVAQRAYQESWYIFIMYCVDSGNVEERLARSRRTSYTIHGILYLVFIAQIIFWIKIAGIVGLSTTTISAFVNWRIYRLIARLTREEAVRRVMES